MKISIVTAVYNRKNTIADAIDSVRSQSYKNIEHIIQDGGSTDGTLDLIASNFNNSRLSVQSGPDGGIYDAINRGIARSTGDVIGLLHSDDFFKDGDVISKVVQAFADRNVSGVYGDLQYVSAQKSTKIVRHWKAGLFKPSLLARGWMPPHPTVFLKRDVLTRYGNYDLKYQIAADYDAMVRYFSADDVIMKYVPEVLVKMRTGGASNRSIGQILRKSKEDYAVIRKNKIGGFRTLLLKNISKVSQFHNLG